MGRWFQGQFRRNLELLTHFHKIKGSSESQKAVRGPSFATRYELPLPRMSPFPAPLYKLQHCRAPHQGFYGKGTFLLTKCQALCKCHQFCFCPFSVTGYYIALVEDIFIFLFFFNFIYLFFASSPSFIEVHLTNKNCTYLRCTM